VRCRFNQAVLKAVYVEDGKVKRAEYTDVFAALFSRPSSNEWIKVPPAGFMRDARARAYPAGRPRSALRAPGGSRTKGARNGFAAGLRDVPSFVGRMLGYKSLALLVNTALIRD
jgi:hypothetical protein